jgi:hypothetical protein
MLRSSKTASTPTRFSDESGQSLVELAFAIPLVLLVILALVDFGLALNTWIDATQVATEGARMASVDGPQVTCQNLAKQIQSDAFGGLSGGTVRITLPGTSVNGQPISAIGQPVKVIVTAKYDYTPGALIPGSLNIAAAATMRLEQPFPSAPCAYP